MIPTNTDDRGQVGIGTLIIFIALVLVAAVAAGVLIDTSGQLESRASDTGVDAQAEVSNQVDVISATGTIDSSSSNVDTITLVVKKSAGSDPIDLSEATIQYTSDSSSKTLTSNEFSLSGETTLSNTDNRADITIDIDDTSGLSPLSEGGDAQLEIVDQSGASTVYGVNIPDVLTGDYVSV